MGPDPYVNRARAYVWHAPARLVYVTLSRSLSVVMLPCDSHQFAFALGLHSCQSIYFRESLLSAGSLDPFRRRKGLCVRVHGMSIVRHGFISVMHACYSGTSHRRVRPYHMRVGASLCSWSQLS